MERPGQARGARHLLLAVLAHDLVDDGCARGLDPSSMSSSASVVICVLSPAFRGVSEGGRQGRFLSEPLFSQPLSGTGSIESNAPSRRRV
jgi:hypothetical protein